MKITIIITSLLFTFVIFLIYLIYCYAYYDESKLTNLADTFNTHKVDKIYEVFTDDITKEELSSSLDLLLSKNSLKEIYYEYYSNIYDIDEFMKQYYFGDTIVTSEDLVYQKEGKTTLFTRSKFYLQGINLTNKDGYQSYIGYLENIALEIENNSTLTIDNEQISCTDNICNISKILGGLHEINYVSNNYEYYGLINIYQNNQTIDIAALDSITKISTQNNISITENKEYNITSGVYKITKCYLDSDCANKKISYIKLYSDGTCKVYTWLTIDQAGDYYEGTYKVNKTFLELSFSSHTYSVFDYDTKQTTKIKVDVDILLKYQIIDEKTFEDDSYRYVYKGTLEE